MGDPDIDVRLAAGGWRAVAATAAGRLHLPVGSRLPVRRLGRDGLIIGRYHGPLGLALSPSGHPCPVRLTSMGWGRYVAIWEETGRLFAFRDPAGALDLLSWRSGAWTFVGSGAPPLIDAHLPADAELDWSRIRRVLGSPAEAFGESLIRGFTAAAPGAVIEPGGPIPAARQIWTPAGAARRRGDCAPGALRDVVDDVVGLLIAPHAAIVGEISGGFDSAVAALSAARTSGNRRMSWINHHAAAAESDERVYARAVADRMSADLTCIARHPRPLARANLTALGTGLRPALQGLDVDYDAAAAGFVPRSGATALLTGQGGDTVFLHSGGPALAIDRARRLGVAGLAPGFLHRTALWTRTSAWSMARAGLAAAAGLRRAAPPEETAADHGHPWRADLADLPPMKRAQIHQLVNCQAFHGDCLRARAGELLQPFLTQPVMEHLLAIPADVLVRGERDRALARHAFADRLPASVAGRRGKGDMSAHYGAVVRNSLPVLGRLLRRGRLIGAGALEEAELEELLDPDVLIWRGDFNRLLVAAVLEAWTDGWTRRLRTANRPLHQTLVS